MIRIVGIIPARMASSRFPGKPLALILGLPMIEHVRRRVALAPSMSQVVVATCDQAISEMVTASGGVALPTSPAHERCTDRVAEAAETMDADIVVNVQGDEPCVHPEMLEALVQPLVNDSRIVCANLMAPIIREEEFDSPDVVKVVVDLNGDALYFSRESVPSRRKAPAGKCMRFKQLGIVAFRGWFLQAFAKLKETPLEIAESVDMMRALEHGYKIRMVQCDELVVGVDRPGDIERAEALLRGDALVRRYWR